jgi:hypothetical protein
MHYNSQVCSNDVLWYNTNRKVSHDRAVPAHASHAAAKATTPDPATAVLSVQAHKTQLHSSSIMHRQLHTDDSNPAATLYLLMRPLPRPNPAPPILPPAAVATPVLTHPTTSLLIHHTLPFHASAVAQPLRIHITQPHPHASGTTHFMTSNRSKLINHTAHHCTCPCVPSPRQSLHLPSCHQQQ